MATVAPLRGVGSDIFTPLMEIWDRLKSDPEELIEWYASRRRRVDKEGKEIVYEDVRRAYNDSPNGADFLFLTRACYGGIVRFRKRDGYMSTPCGAHMPVSVDSFRRSVSEWGLRMKDVSFRNCDYKVIFEEAREGDFIYCDPPYAYSQPILYGAQDFKLEELMIQIDRAKTRGVKVALSIDGSKKSGDILCNLPIPDGLFEEEYFIHRGKSMLKRFQSGGGVLIGEEVADRLLLSYTL